MIGGPVHGTQGFARRVDYVHQIGDDRVIHASRIVT
jgi:hypothetical protein